MKLLLLIVSTLTLASSVTSWSLFPVTDVDDLLDDVDLNTHHALHKFNRKAKHDTSKTNRFPHPTSGRPGTTVSEESSIQLFERVVVVDECRKRVADEYAQYLPCDSMVKDGESSTEAQTAFTLAITNCHLEFHGKATFKSPTVSARDSRAEFKA